MIYLDHAATTPVDSRVADRMFTYFTEKYFNPSLGYRNAIRVKSEIAEARKIIADSIGAKENEVFFTSGGTESDNWAIKGIAYANRKKGNHIISTMIEHPAVYESLKQLEDEGFKVTFLSVDNGGRVDIDELEKSICSETILISVMYANNETGVIQPVEDIGRIAKKYGVLFHTDAVQAFGHIPVNVDDISADLISASSHKIYGPKACGFLYVRNGTKINPLIVGGKQEKNLRGGTENVAGIIGFSEAAKLAMSELEARMEKEKKLSSILKEGILSNIKDATLNGDEGNRLPGNLNFSFAGVEGESLLIQLDMKNICISTGSACSFGNGQASRILLAMGLTEEEARSSLRISVGYENTEDEMEEALKAIIETINYLRSIRL